MVSLGFLCSLVTGVYFVGQSFSSFCDQNGNFFSLAKQET